MRLPAVAAGLLYLLLAGPLGAQDSQESIRDSLIENIRNSDIGAGYAQMLNFFVLPSISATRLEAEDGTEYDIFKVPLQLEFTPGGEGWRLAVRER